MNEEDYWDLRTDAMYLQNVFYIARAVGKDALSLLDVGSNNGQYVEWFDWIPRRISLDLRRPYESGTIEGVRGDFLKYQPEQRFDLTLCLQVPEHIESVEAFCQHLLNVSRHLIISVPYFWDGGTRGHLHDSVDEEMVDRWMGRKLNYSIVVVEPLQVKRHMRLVNYYDVDHPGRRVSPAERDARRRVRRS